MAENATRPTGVPVPEFLATVGEARAVEARTLIEVCERISGEPATMWGPSIIGFGSREYETSRGGEATPRLAFSPRKAKLTVYFAEGFGEYDELLVSLGPHTRSVSCLYLTRLERVDLDALAEMLRRSFAQHRALGKPTTVAEYAARVPAAAQERFARLRGIVRDELSGATEKLSYGVIGFVPPGERRARVFVSGWKDHVALYPVPADAALQARLAPYRKGKGTLWFALDEPLPEDLLRSTAAALYGGTDPA